MARDRVYLFLRWSSLALLCLVAFWPMFRNGFVWDDVEFIVGNPVIRSLWPPGRFLQSQGAVAEGTIYPLTGQRPVMAFSLAVDYHFWKLNPFGYHLTSLLLHFLCIGGVMLLTWETVRSRWASVLAGAIFAVHPGHAEAVIAFLGRSDLLATAFGLAGFWMYGRYREGKRKLLWYLGSLISYLAACFSKETGLILLGLLIVYEGSGLGKRNSKIQDLKSKIVGLLPFLMVALGYWMYRGRILGGQAAGTEWWGGSAFTTFLMMLEAYVRYLGLLLFPLRLSPLHAVTVPQSFRDGEVLLGAGLLGLTFGAVIWAFRRHLRAGFWGAWFLLSLVPVANIIPIPGVILAERWLYLPSVGACVLGSWGVCVLYAHAKGWTRPVWAGLIVLVLVLFGLRTFFWNSAWRTEESVARVIVETSPDSYLGKNNLGNALLSQGKFSEAEQQLRESIWLKPDYFLSHNNLGAALEAQRRYPEAESEFRQALHIRPSYAEAHNNLGSTLWKTGRTQEALSEFREAIHLKPDKADFHNNLGLTYRRTGALSEAVNEFQTAIHLKPDHAEAYHNLGVVLGLMGQTKDAEAALNEALRFQPNIPEAHFNLGLLLEVQGRTEEAIREYRLYLAYAPQAEDREQVEEKITRLEQSLIK